MKLKKHIGKILSLALVVSMSVIPAYAITFNDLQGYGWAEKYISDVTNKGIITGYPDLTFKPGSPVTRIESLIMISNLFPKSEIDAVFANNKAKYDSKLNQYKVEDWAKPYIIFALEKNIIPNTDRMLASLVDKETKRSITAMRYEVCVFLVRGLGLEGELKQGVSLSYKDSKDIITQAVPYVELLQRKGILSKQGDGNGYFFPNKSITRAETAVMISNAYKYSPKAQGTNTKPPTTPTQPTTPSQEIINGKIDLLTFADNNVTLAITTNDGKTRNFTAKQKDLSIKSGDKIISINDIKVGQQAQFTINNGTLTQISVSMMETQRYSGTLTSFSTQDKTLTIEVKSDTKSETKVLRYDDNTKIYVNDTLTPVDKLPTNVSIDLNVENNIVVKASIVFTKSEFSGEITDYSYNSLTINTEKDGKISKEFSKDIKIYRNDKRLDSVSSLAVGDIAKIITDNDKIVEISVEAKSQKYLSSVIKGIQMNSSYNKIVIDDRDGREHVLTINNDTIIRINDKKTNIYSLKLGYEVDVYAQGGLIEEIDSRGEFKQTTVNGKVTDIDFVDKFIEIKQNDGKLIKLYYDNNTKIEQLSNGAIIEARKILKGDALTGIGVLNGGNITATRIIVEL